MEGKFYREQIRIHRQSLPFERRVFELFRQIKEKGLSAVAAREDLDKIERSLLELIVTFEANFEDEDKALKYRNIGSKKDTNIEKKNLLIRRGNLTTKKTTDNDPILPEK